MGDDPVGVLKVSLESAEHYAWGRGCDGWHLVNHPQAGGVEYPLQAGEGLHVDPGVPHQMFNRSAERVEFVVVSQPHSHGDRELVG